MSIRRFLLWFIAGVSVLMLIAAATLYWASRSETMLRWGIDRFATSLPCTLTVQGLRGTFMEPLHIQYLACENADYRVEARDIALVWSPWSLRSRRLEITSLRIAALTVASKKVSAKADTPMQAPQDLRLPIEIDVASLEIEAFGIETGDRSVALKAIDASYHGDRDSHRLALRNLESQWGRAAGEATIGTSAPLPLTAKLSVSTDRVEGWPVSADIELAGELQTMSATIQAMAGKLRVVGKLDLTPFDPEPVQLITARVSDIDAAAFDARLPHTAVVATMQAKPVGMSALTGRLVAENSNPGRLDEQLLPAQSLDANFALDMASLQLSDLRLDLGAAGTVTGAAQIASDRITLALDVRNLNLQAARGDLRQTKLNGSIKVDRRGERQLVAVDLRQKDMQLEGNAEVTAQRIVIERMMARASGAQLRASAKVELDDRLGFSLDGALTRFDPARFGDFPQADINATLQVRGTVRPEWAAEVNYQLGRSRLSGVALDGSGRFQISPTRLHAARIQLDYGGNDLKLSGDFGNPGDTLMFALDAKHLDRLDADAAGTMQVSGTLTGTIKRPAIKADLKGQKIAFAGLRIDEAEARINTEQADDPVIRAQAKLQRINRGELVLDSVDVSVGGTLGRHTVELAVAAAQLQLAGRLDGGWDKSRSVWSGRVAQLENKGEYAFKMQRPATIELAQDRVLLGATKVEFSQTVIEVGETRFQNGRLLTQGTVSGVRAARVFALMDKPPAVESTLVLGARWEIRVDETVDGFVELSRTEGDIVIPGEEPLALGLKELRVTLRAAANQITAEAVIRSAQIDAQASAQTRLEKRGAKWGVVSNAPLQLRTQGIIRGVQAKRLFALMDKPPAVESTLVLGARWEIRADEAVDGFIEVTRADGDIVIAGEEPLALGLKELRLTLRAAANQITAEAVMRSAQIDAQGSAQTRLDKRGAKWGVAGTAPLILNAKTEMRSVRPLAALASRAITADGQLNLVVKGSGTVAEPRLSGNVEGSNLKIEHVANGIFFDQGVIRANFSEDALTLTEFRIRGGQGELTARGHFTARKGDPTMDLEWAARKMAVVQHPELRLIVSGEGQLGYRDATVSLKGKLTADQGRVELRKRTFPTLDSDVVITGRETSSQLSGETKRAILDLQLDLGPDFTVVGRGLNARIEGQIRLTSSADKPLSADGEIRVASGTFEAYGRRLQIEKGALYFAGPVNNPGLNIRAMRKNQQVEAGVEVTGTARDPRVRLVSDPEVSDPNKLAWLVLGREADTTNTQDNRALQSSAMALAAGLGTSPFQQQLARAVGVDEISFIPGTSQSQGGVVAVGKQISDRIYVSQEFGMSAAGNTLRVSYQLTRRWSVRTQSGETDAVDLFFTFSFD